MLKVSLLPCTVSTFADMEGEETFDSSFLGSADEVVVAGGGAVEAALSVYLEYLATTLGSREQLAIAEFAESLLIIPKVLAVNAAKDATDLVAKLCAYHHTAQTKADKKHLSRYVYFKFIPTTIGVQMSRARLTYESSGSSSARFELCFQSPSLARLCFIKLELGSGSGSVVYYLLISIVNKNDINNRLFRLASSISKARARARLLNKRTFRFEVGL
ncbi:putative chaperonin Cpn60/TCP-1 family, groEL-like equatorial domain superfamily [Helianthus annuus]|nr:putative chaperonin Cpn60/TCP-1 family, groEL-like equatorial domain superfamily [Helianthus annuus]